MARSDLKEGAAAFFTRIAQRRVQKQDLKLIQQQQKQEDERKREEFEFMQDARFEDFQRRQEFLAGLEAAPLTPEEKIQFKVDETRALFELGEELEPPEETFFGLTREKIITHADKFQDEVLDEIFGTDITAPVKFSDIQKQRGREAVSILGREGGALTEDAQQLLIDAGLGDPLEAAPFVAADSGFNLADFGFADEGSPKPIVEQPDVQPQAEVPIGEAAEDVSGEDALKSATIKSIEEEKVDFNEFEESELQRIEKSAKAIWARRGRATGQDDVDRADRELNSLMREKNKLVRDAKDRIAKDKPTPEVRAKNIKKEVNSLLRKFGSVIGPSGRKRAYNREDFKADLAAAFEDITEDELTEAVIRVQEVDDRLPSAHESARLQNEKYLGEGEGKRKPRGRFDPP